MTSIKINNNVFIECEVYSNSKTWGHIARCFYLGQEVAKNKICYYNRTWEAYQFDSVKSGLLAKIDKEKIIPLLDRIAIAKAIKCND